MEWEGSLWETISESGGFYKIKCMYVVKGVETEFSFMNGIGGKEDNCNTEKYLSNIIELMVTPPHNTGGGCGWKTWLGRRTKNERSLRDLD